MGLTGKYNFPGIKKAGAAAIRALLASTTWGAALLAKPFLKFISPLTDLILEAAVQFMANNGLVILNLGANWVNGEFDQAAFDKSLEDGLRRMQTGREKITPAEGKAIDDQVIKAADRFIPFNREP